MLIALYDLLARAGSGSQPCNVSCFNSFHFSIPSHLHLFLKAGQCLALSLTRHAHLRFLRILLGLLRVPLCCLSCFCRIRHLLLLLLLRQRQRGRSNRFCVIKAKALARLSATASSYFFACSVRLKGGQISYKVRLATITHPRCCRSRSKLQTNQKINQSIHLDF